MVLLSNPWKLSYWKPVTVALFIVLNKDCPTAGPGLHQHLNKNFEQYFHLVLKSETVELKTVSSGF